MEALLSVICLLVVIIIATWLKYRLRAKYLLLGEEPGPFVLVLLVQDCEEKIEGIMRELINWRQQSGNVFEVVAVDRNSTDATWQILTKLNYPYLEYYVLEESHYNSYGLLGLGLGDPARTAVLELNREDDLSACVAKVKQAVAKELLFKAGNEL